MNQPKTVMLCSNGMVLVFDAAGSQMTELQGRHEQVTGKLQAIDLDGCEFIYGNWVTRTQRPLTREEFFNLEAADPHVFEGKYR